jgi:hypothetical protein
MVRQVPADRVGAGVQPGPLELLAQPKHPLDRLRPGRRRAGLRGAGQRLERRLTVGPIAGHEPADPALRDAIGAGDFGLRLTGENSGDDKATFRHAAACEPSAIPKTCDTLFRCRETPHSDVLNQDTVVPTGKPQRLVLMTAATRNCP